MAAQIRQGDVLLIPRAAPEGAQLRGGDSLVLARGEVTGHAHRLLGPVAAWRGEDGRRYVLVGEGVTITHEEHDPIPAPVPPGWYEVRQQQTWWADGWRRVRD